MQEWIQAVKEAFLGVSEVHDEARAVAQMETERLEKLVELWDKGLMEASERAAKSPAREGGAVKYSFVGERALTADRDQLQRAQQLEKQNADAEQIRQETGWFRGLDGKWRFEIDDSGMQLFRGGDAQFAKDHPEYGEYKELLNKVILGTANAEEIARVKELEDTWGRELPRLSQRVKLGGATLENIIQHDRLFAAYPELRSVRVRFLDLGRGVNGEYSRKTNAIILNENLRNKDNGTILHEIQHAIQKIEGFTPGASKEYWEEQLRNGYEDERRSEEYKAADKKYRDLLEAAPAELKEKLRELDRAKSDGDVDALDRISEELYEGPFADKFIEIDQADYERRRIFYSEKDSLAAELYFNTAGEIEARDTADRAGSSEAERKSTRPDLDRRGVVFADDVGEAQAREIDKYYERQIEQWDGLDHGGAFRVGKVSKALLEIGVPDVDIWFDQSKAAKQLATKDEISKKELNKIPHVLNHPIVISESYDKTVMVFGQIHDDAGNPIVIAVRINATNRRNKISVVNKIRSIGTRTHNLDKLLSEGSILYLGENKKETKKWFNALGRSTPFGGTKFGLIRSISFDYQNSNTKFQERDELPDDRALLMQARAEGRNAESLTAYQKKVRSLEALERKLKRQQDALEAAKNYEAVDAKGEPLPLEEQKKFNRETVKAVKEQIQKTKASIRRAEKALADMERKPEMRQELGDFMVEHLEGQSDSCVQRLRHKFQFIRRAMPQFFHSFIPIDASSCGRYNSAKEQNRGNPHESHRTERHFELSFPLQYPIRAGRGARSLCRCQRQ